MFISSNDKQVKYLDLGQFRIKCCWKRLFPKNKELQRLKEGLQISLNKQYSLMHSYTTARVNAQNRYIFYFPLFNDNLPWRF